MEWETGAGATIALTGSANLRVAAMLSTTDQGGNCALATAHPVEESLLPEGVVAPVRADALMRTCRLGRGRGCRPVPARTGLGVALVAQHIGGHRGQVWVTDRPGDGARFVVGFPQAPL